MADQVLVDQIDALKRSNAALIQKIADDESNLNQESFQKYVPPRIDSKSF